MSSADIMGARPTPFFQGIFPQFLHLNIKSPAAFFISINCFDVGNSRFHMIVGNY